MDATHLRIGNWVISPIDGEAQINEKGIAHQVKHPGYYQPVELTEEWLIKAGFEKEDMADLGIHVYIPISETADYCLSWSGGTIWLEQHDTGAKYVHQLQNLYFCLTGEEITFNL